MIVANLRLDKALVDRGLVESRSQADNIIRLGYVYVNGRQIRKSGYFVSDTNIIELKIDSILASRAGLKLASIASDFKLDFNNKVVLDIGSSTGGFTDYAILHGAQKVYCVDVGSNQLHPSLRTNPKILVHEKTDIRDFKINFKPDIIMMDVSFISVRKILPVLIGNNNTKQSQFVILVKPQFEASISNTHNGVIKNDTMRRKILKDFEVWARELFLIICKKDSLISGQLGNKERFYLLTLKRNSTISSGRIT